MAPLLAEAGFKVAVVRYSGSEDEGFLEEVVLFREDEVDENFKWKNHKAPTSAEEAALLRRKIAHAPIVEWDDTTRTETELGEWLNNYAWRILEANHPGWEINDGADGRIIFINDGRVLLEHNARYSSYEHFHDEL